MADLETYETAGQQAASDVRAGASRFKRQVNETKAQLQDKAETAWEDVIDSVRQHPIQAIGITLAAGAALGAIAVALARSGEPTTAQKIRGWADTGADAWGDLRKSFKKALIALKDNVDGVVEKYK